MHLNADLERWQVNLTKPKPRTLLERILTQHDGHFVDIKAVPIRVDLCALPCIPHGWEILSHRGAGETLDLSTVKLGTYLTDGQRNATGERSSPFLKGHEVHAALQGLPVLNATVLDFLIDNPSLIPEEWKLMREIFFHGTTYIDSEGCESVRGLCLLSDHWCSFYRPLSDNWTAAHPAAIERK